MRIHERQYLLPWLIKRLMLKSACKRWSNFEIRTEQKMSAYSQLQGWFGHCTKCCEDSPVFGRRICDRQR